MLAGKLYVNKFPHYSNNNKKIETKPKKDIKLTKGYYQYLYKGDGKTYPVLLTYEEKSNQSLSIEINDIIINFVMFNDDDEGLIESIEVYDIVNDNLHYYPLSECFKSIYGMLFIAKDINTRKIQVQDQSEISIYERSEEYIDILKNYYNDIVNINIFKESKSYVISDEYKAILDKLKKAVNNNEPRKIKNIFRLKYNDASNPSIYAYYIKYILSKYENKTTIIAIGRSGTGKTALLKTLARLYDGNKITFYNSKGEQGEPEFDKFSETSHKSTRGLCVANLDANNVYLDLPGSENRIIINKIMKIIKFANINFDESLIKKSDFILSLYADYFQNFNNSFISNFYSNENLLIIAMDELHTDFLNFTTDKLNLKYSDIKEPDFELEFLKPYNRNAIKCFYDINTMRNPPLYDFQVYNLIKDISILNNLSFTNLYEFIYYTTFESIEQPIFTTNVFDLNQYSKQCTKIPSINDVKYITDQYKNYKLDVLTIDDPCYVPKNNLIPNVYFYAKVYTPKILYHSLINYPFSVYYLNDEYVLETIKYEPNKNLAETINIIFTYPVQFIILDKIILTFPHIHQEIIKQLRDKKMITEPNVFNAGINNGKNYIAENTIALEDSKTDFKSQFKFSCYLFAKPYSKSFHKYSNLSLDIYDEVDSLYSVNLKNNSIIYENDTYYNLLNLKTEHGFISPIKAYASYINNELVFGGDKYGNPIIFQKENYAKWLKPKPSNKSLLQYVKSEINLINFPYISVEKKYNILSTSGIKYQYDPSDDYIFFKRLCYAFNKNYSIEQYLKDLFAHINYKLKVNRMELTDYKNNTFKFYMEKGIEFIFNNIITYYTNMTNGPLVIDVYLFLTTIFDKSLNTVIEKEFATSDNINSIKKYQIDNIDLKGYEIKVNTKYGYNKRLSYDEEIIFTSDYSTIKIYLNDNFNDITELIYNFPLNGVYNEIDEYIGVIKNEYIYRINDTIYFPLLIPQLGTWHNKQEIDEKEELKYDYYVNMITNNLNDL